MVLLTNDINLACSELLKGNLVAFPTETVYGLGALVTNDQAVQKIFKVKQRPLDHPLILHCKSFNNAKEYCIDIPEIAYKFAEQFMPGPLTLILKRNPNVASIAAANLDTIAIRVPKHPIAQEILTLVKDPIAAPSANLYTRPSATNYTHVVDDFKDEDILIFQADQCDIGIESTILNLSKQEEIELVRPGFYTLQDLELVTVGKIKPSSTIKASGNKEYHYSPQQQVYILAGSKYQNVVSEFPNQVVAAIGFTKPKDMNDDLFIKMSDDPIKYAESLYTSLRKLEQTNADVIVINETSNDYEWAAINDRISKASAK